MKGILSAGGRLWPSFLKILGMTFAGSGCSFFFSEARHSMLKKSPLIRKPTAWHWESIGKNKIKRLIF